MRVTRRARDLIRTAPVLGPAVLAAKAFVTRRLFRDSIAYWERRYSRGGDSGPGSRGRLALFKAEVVNDFVQKQGVGSVIEFGCGDGAQLALARYPSYTGLDVSRTALRRCRERFADDPTKSFFLYDPSCFVDHQGVLRADLALSLDVIFHLVEDGVFELYMRHLFSSATRFVLIYSKDDDQRATVGHVRNRRFTPWVEQNLPGWLLIERIQNEYPWQGDLASGSESEFFIYAPT